MDSDIYNADELIPPTWMDRDFFETVLRKARSGNIQRVIEYKICPATVKGNHYASLMFRGIVQYLDKADVKQEISLIVKTMPEIDGAKMDLLKESTIFEVEIKMFRDIIPNFQEMLRAAGDNTKISANMLYYSLNPRKIIVLEDITKLGFATVGKRMCTLEESKMALDVLAKWHACSFILNKETEGSLENFTNGVYNMSGIESNPVFTTGTKKLVALAKKTPQLQPYLESLEKIQDKVFKKCTKAYDVSKRKCFINVLAHGDFHVNNLMFRFNSNSKLAEKIILVDFQLSVWGSMALDLSYFIYLVIAGEIREVHRDELIHNYFKNFLDTLQLLGYKGEMPKYSDLLSDIESLCFIEMYLTATFLPFMVALVENPKMDLDDIMSNNDTATTFYNSQLYIKEVEQILKGFLHKGYFDRIYDEDDDDS